MEEVAQCMEQLPRHEEKYSSCLRGDKFIPIYFFLDLDLVLDLATGTGSETL